MTGYSLQEIPVYNEQVDGETKYGVSHGLIRRPIVGGNWGDNLNCGSRSVDCNNFSDHVRTDFTARGCKENKNILGLLGMEKTIIFSLDMIGKIIQYIIRL